MIQRLKTALISLLQASLKSLRKEDTEATMYMQHVNTVTCFPDALIKGQRERICQDLENYTGLGNWFSLKFSFRTAF